MSSLASALPTPVRGHGVHGPPKPIAPPSRVTSSTGPPPYRQRKGWIPRTLADFGDGGAFPELHVAQFPLGMGKKKNKGKTIAMQVDAEGNVKHDVLAKQGQRKDVVVHSSIKGVLTKDVVEGDLSSRPDDNIIEQTTEETRLKLEKIINSKVAAAKPVSAAEPLGPAQYIRYTPAQQGDEYASGSKQRIIRMVEMPEDPMAPPKFQHKKVPKGPPSPPPPVLHSPPRKVTPQEQSEWKIPPCISNWKNPKGYTVPLDKRLAADGRGLQEQQINHNFADLAAALYHADRKAREGVELRASIQKKVSQMEKEKHETNLRALAQKARDERAGIQHHSEEESEEEAVVDRDRIRDDRKYERDRERKMANSKPEKRTNAARNNEDRDISEKIALGVAVKTNVQGENLYDQRLFNQTKGMGSGLQGDDDVYNVYDKPLFNKNQASSMYRPRNVDSDMLGDEEMDKLRKSRFQADKGFEGADSGAARDGPVQFEKDEDDVFGLDKFFTEAKKGKALDNIGQGSSLTAGSSSSTSTLRDGGKRSINFEGGRAESKRSRR
eukprot:CFRG5394T1